MESLSTAKEEVCFRTEQREMESHHLLQDLLQCYSEKKLRYHAHKFMIDDKQHSLYRLTL